MTIEKPCSTCKLSKPLEEFHREKSRPDGHGYRCKSCSVVRNREYRASLTIEEKQRRQKMYDRKRKYGLPYGRYEEMLDNQRHRCAGCGIHENETPRGLFVDHDHETGQVRALLCIKCNGILGYCNDDDAQLASLIDYLVSHRQEMVA